MIKCTEPELWTTVPESDASEEDVARYLAHVERCAFHAAIERSEEAQMRNVAALATSDLGGESPEAADVLEGLNELGIRRRGAFIRTLAIRVNGSERARLDLLEDSQRTLDVEEGALIGVWQADQSNAARDLYLTSYVVDQNWAAAGEKRVSSTVLEGGQRISFAGEPRGNCRVRITVAYAETEWRRVLRLSWERLKQNLGFGTGELRWSSALKLTVALLVLLAALVLLPFLLFRTRAPGPRVNEQPTLEPPAAVVPHPPNSNGEVSATPTIERNIRPRPNAPIQTSVADVSRVYVSLDKGEYNKQLRVALIAELQRSGRFTVVTREEEADALLVSETTRGASVRVQLLNRARKPLWFTTQPLAGDSLEDVGGVAAGIVRALSNEAKSSQGSPTPRR